MPPEKSSDRPPEEPCPICQGNGTRGLMNGNTMAVIECEVCRGSGSLPVFDPTRVHCWADGPPTEDGCSTTCMLWAAHAGPHEWSRDDEITIAFAEAEPVYPEVGADG